MLFGYHAGKGGANYVDQKAPGTKRVMNDVEAVLRLFLTHKNMSRAFSKLPIAWARDLAWERGVLPFPTAY